MTVARGVRSGANCVAERGRLGSFENHSTLPPESRSTANDGMRVTQPTFGGPANALSCALLRAGVELRLYESESLCDHGVEHSRRKKCG
jgi:hypothetical protein